MYTVLKISVHCIKDICTLY